MADSMHTGSNAMRIEHERYRAMLPWQIDLDAFCNGIESIRPKSLCAVDIGMPSPMMSLALHKTGGTWSSLCLSTEESRRFSECLGEAVPAWTPQVGPLPFEDHAFSLVILGFGALDAVGDMNRFLRECHRILAVNGRLLLSIRNAKRFSTADWFCSNALRNRRNVSPTFTERELYEQMKIGFDVLSVHAYLRFFVQCVYNRHCSRCEQHRVSSVPRSVRFAYRIAHQLDGFLFCTRGHRLMVQARRRIWRERNSSVFREGRPVSDAVLSRIA